jgi:hypothetical protein
MTLTNDDFMKFLAWRQLMHETADEEYKDSIARGFIQESGEMNIGSRAFIDGLAAQIEQLKEELKAELASPDTRKPDEQETSNDQVERIAFELGELRGQLESMRVTLDALAEKLL